MWSINIVDEATTFACCWIYKTKKLKVITSKNVGVTLFACVLSKLMVPINIQVLSRGAILCKYSIKNYHKNYQVAYGDVNG